MEYSDNQYRNNNLIYFPAINGCSVCGRNDPIYIDQKNKTKLGWLIDCRENKIFCSYECANKL